MNLCKTARSVVALMAPMIVGFGMNVPAMGQDAPCGDPDAGSCYQANGTPGCDCSDCCEQVCLVDPYCCEGSWDTSCIGILHGGEVSCPDSDCDEIPDACDLQFDCNGNETEDAVDISSGFSSDLDGDGIPDECEGPLDVVFVLDVTSSKSETEDLVVRLRDDLLSANSVVRAAIADRANGCARFGLVTFRDQISIEQVLTYDESTFVEACNEIDPFGGAGLAEASDRALLEVLLEGEALICGADVNDPACCTGDGLPDKCELPPVCLELGSQERFDVPFRDGTGRLVVHLTDYFPGGCDDNYNQFTDKIFAERIAELAGEKGIRVIALADSADAEYFGHRYADESDGAFLGRCFNEISVQALADTLKSVDLGDDFVAACPADLNGDGVVSGADLGLMLTNWSLWGVCLQGDLNRDGTVNGADLGMILGGWGACP